MNAKEGAMFYKERNQAKEPANHANWRESDFYRRSRREQTAIKSPKLTYKASHKWCPVGRAYSRAAFFHSQMAREYARPTDFGIYKMSWRTGRASGVFIRKVVRCPDFIGRNACRRSLGRSLGDRPRSLGRPLWRKGTNLSATRPRSVTPRG